MENTDFESYPGAGAQADVLGETIRVGERAYLQNNGIALRQELLNQAQDLQKQGKTVTRITEGKVLLGAIAIADPIKSTTPDAIATLHRIGIKIIMCTGDNSDTARAVSSALGIQDYRGEVSPKDKQDLVEDLKSQGHRVAMACDGINDAPALAAADLGIAMGTGTGVAMESTGITLVTGDLQGTVSSIALSKAVMRNIRQNLFFAFFYNAIGIPIAAEILYPFFGILLSPMIAGITMSFSSVSAICSALRLKN